VGDRGREHGRRGAGTGDWNTTRSIFWLCRLSYRFLTTAEEAHSVISVIIEPQLQTKAINRYVLLVEIHMSYERRLPLYKRA
jgi:hypothetical protein